MPKLAAFFLFVALSSLGLPILNGFVGEYLILLGTYQSHWAWASWAALGVILSACYLLWSYQRVWFGEITHEKNKSLPDVSARERWILITMALVTLWMGVGSAFITNRTARSSQTVIDQVNPQRLYEGQAPASPAVNAPNAHSAVPSTAAPIAIVTPALAQQISMERRATR